MLRRLGQWLALRIDTHPLLARTVIVAILVGLNIWGYERFHAKRNPRYTLERIGDAIRGRDSATFDTEADVDSIAKSFYDQHILPERIANGTALIAGVREHDAAAIARRLRRWVETARIDETEKPRLTLLADFVRSGLERNSETIDLINTSRTVSIAEVSLTDRFGIRAQVELRLVNSQGFWRLAEITNVEDLAGQLRRAEVARIGPAQRRPLD